MSQSDFTDRRPPRRRGMAEVELVLMMPLIIVLLFLLIAAMRLHDARQRVHADAVARAWHNAAETTAIPDFDIDDVEFKNLLTVLWLRDPLEIEDTPDSSIDLSELPRHAWASRSAETVDLKIGGAIFMSPELESRSVVIGPAWTYIDNATYFGFSRNARLVRGWYTRLGTYADADLAEDLKLAGD